MTSGLLRKSDITSFARFIAKEEMPDIFSGKSAVIGVMDNDEPAGAAVIELVLGELCISFFSVKPGDKEDEICRELFETVKSFAKKSKTGKVRCELILPDMEVQRDLVLKNGFSFEAEETVFYWIKADCIDSLEILAPGVKKKAKSSIITAVSDLSTSERAAFFRIFNEDSLKVFDPKNIPYTFLSKYSYVIVKDGEFPGFVTSFMGTDYIYLGGLYSRKGYEIYVLSLLERFLSELKGSNLKFKSVMFAAVTSASEKLAEHIIRELPKDAVTKKTLTVYSS